MSGDSLLEVRIVDKIRILIHILYKEVRNKLESKGRKCVRNTFSNNLVIMGRQSELSGIQFADGLCV